MNSNTKDHYHSASPVHSQSNPLDLQKPVNDVNVVTFGAFEKKTFPKPALSDTDESISGSIGSSSGESYNDGVTQLTLRALVSTKEAGVIIGKSGKNVADLRENAHVKAGVSKVVLGIHDRVLSITGPLENVAHAYELVANNLVQNSTSSATLSPSRTANSPPKRKTTVVRILISHNLMGTIIGKQGVKIKHIQDVSGARLIATKEMLPQSTERVVEIHGSVNDIRIAIFEVGKCLIEDGDRGVGTVLYNPAARVPTVSSLANPYVNNPRASVDFSSTDNDPGSPNYSRNRSFTTASSLVNSQDLMFSSFPVPPQSDSFINTNPQSSDRLLSSQFSLNNRIRSQSVNYNRASFHSPEVRTQEISIPGDMVGCIIGKAGSRITEIRRISGSRIEIAKASDSDSGERLFTITGTPECNEKALYLLYGQLEAERERRLANARLAADLESLGDLSINEN